MKTCYGTIYPDLLNFHFGKHCTGKVFDFMIESRGAGHRDIHLVSKNDEWDMCQQCEVFRSCIDFSTAKLHMQQVVNSI